MIKKIQIGLTLLVLPFLFLAACGGSGAVEIDSGSSSNAAMVDEVIVDFRGNHYYAIVNGFYPDSCTQISEVRQEVSGSTFSLSLSTDKPGEMMCAQMLTQFEVAILLETGGLPPGEYSVEVNERSTDFTLGDQ